MFTNIHMKCILSNSGHKLQVPEVQVPAPAAPGCRRSPQRYHEQRRLRGLPLHRHQVRDQQSRQRQWLLRHIRHFCCPHCSVRSLSVYYCVHKTLIYTSPPFPFLVRSGPATGPGKIVLSGRLNLPEGFGPTPYEKRKELPQRSLDSSTLQVNTTPSSKFAASNSSRGAPAGMGGKGAALQDIAEGSESEGESSGEEDSQAGSGDEEEERSRESSDERKHSSRSIARKRRQETPEEKKARKEAVKEERRQKRSGKKELKNAFRAEGTRIIRSVGNEQSTDHVSVFKYT